MAELVDALDLGSSVLRREGSSPFRRTIQNPNCYNKQLGFLLLWNCQHFANIISYSSLNDPINDPINLTERQKLILQMFSEEKNLSIMGIASRIRFL